MTEMNKKFQAIIDGNGVFGVGLNDINTPKATITQDKSFEI